VPVIGIDDQLFTNGARTMNKSFFQLNIKSYLGMCITLCILKLSSLLNIFPHNLQVQQN
jgi:hypothetical protein